MTLILLDKSPAKLSEYRARYGIDFGQLRTPLTKYARLPGVRYALENGCFKEFHYRRWIRLLDEAEEDRPLFVSLPDVVGDAVRTLELFEHFKLRTNEHPRALVIQDGIGTTQIPWRDLRAIFVGGSDAFKYSAEAFNVAKAAKMLGKWVHVGRVNEDRRMRNWRGIADSIDGSGVSQYDHMLENVIAAMAPDHPQTQLEMTG